MSAYLIDVETTGLDEPVPVEIAMIRLPEPPKVTAYGDADFHSRYNPGKPISLGALATHGILDESLHSFPMADTFLLPDDADFLIGHNVDFDAKAIGSPEVKRICTLALCRSLWPEADSHSLGAMMYFHYRHSAGKRLRGAHSAAQDVSNTLMILDVILDWLKRPATWEEVWQASEKARVPKVMMFGKHKGLKIEDVPGDYRAWLLRQTDVDPYLRKALEGTP